MRMKKLIAILLLLTLGGGVLEAQFIKKAQVGFRFLENPVSAEVVGRGGVGVVNTFTSNAVFWNPALLAWTTSDIDVSLNHTRGIADINYNAIAAGFHLWKSGVLGFSLLAMDYGTFYTTVRAANTEGYVETGTFTPTAIAVGGAFSQQVSDRFSFGVHLKYARQDLGSAWVSTAGSSLSDTNLTLEQREYTEGTMAIDVGAYYDFLYNGIRFGATVQNISQEIRYENEAFPLPFAISFGLAVEPLKFISGIDTVHSLILCFESRHARDYGDRLKFGGEYRFLDIFMARGGYQLNFDERGWTAGAGIKYPVGGVPLRVDYAYEPFGILGSRHYISIGVGH